MPQHPGEPVAYDLTLSTLTGDRHFTGTANVYGQPTAEEIRAAVVQEFSAGLQLPADISINHQS
ncbi:hypothetical protein [Kitasatospora sp. NPDC086791]|uniref:hypothetical protein n=1 Tax=Kitasatospora sp. NPDC086791 TaxID=3155178 RepID=UPI00342B556B